MDNTKIPQQAVKDFMQQLSDAEQNAAKMDPADASRVHDDISKSRNALFATFDDIDIEWEESYATSEMSQIGKPLKERCVELLNTLANIQIRHAKEEEKGDIVEEKPVRDIPKMQFDSFSEWHYSFYNHIGIVHSTFQPEQKEYVQKKLDAVQNFIAVLLAYNPEWGTKRRHASYNIYSGLLQDATTVASSADKQEWFDFGARVESIIISDHDS